MLKFYSYYKDGICVINNSLKFQVATKSFSHTYYLYTNSGMQEYWVLILLCLFPSWLFC
jgi:hypothetical protein